MSLHDDPPDPALVPATPRRVPFLLSATTAAIMVFFVAACLAQIVGWPSASEGVATFSCYAIPLGGLLPLSVLFAVPRPWTWRELRAWSRAALLAAALTAVALAVPPMGALGVVAYWFIGNGFGASMVVALALRQPLLGGRWREVWLCGAGSVVFVFVSGWIAAALGSVNLEFRFVDTFWYLIWSSVTYGLWAALVVWVHDKEPATPAPRVEDVFD